MKTKTQPTPAGTGELMSQATQLAASFGDSLRSLAGLKVPPKSLLKLQGDYLSESTALFRFRRRTRSRPSSRLS